MIDSPTQDSFSILKISFTFWVALYGAILSTLALILNIIITRRDRSKLTLTGMIAKQARDYQGRHFVSAVIEKGKQCLSFSITNVGRRPVKALGLAAKLKFFGSEQLVIICEHLPKTLQEGEDVIEVFYNFDFIKDKPWSIYVFDSLGKNHKMKRKHLKQLYANFMKMQQS